MPSSDVFRSRPNRRRGVGGDELGPGRKVPTVWVEGNRNVQQDVGQHPDYATCSAGEEDSGRPAREKRARGGADVPALRMQMLAILQ